jgi:hypothetical protein
MFWPPRERPALHTTLRHDRQQKTYAESTPYEPSKSGPGELRLTTSHLQTRLPPTLKRQCQNKHPGTHKQRPTNIHGHTRRQIRKHGHNRRHNPKHAIRTRRNRITRSPIPRLENLGGIRIQNRVHNITHKIIRAIPAQQRRGGVCSRTAEEKYAREDRGEGEGAAAAEGGRFDQKAAEQAAGDAQRGDDEGVAVGYVCASVAVDGAAGGEEVGEEGVVEGVAEADGGPYFNYVRVVVG